MAGMAALREARRQLDRLRSDLSEVQARGGDVLDPVALAEVMRGTASPPARAVAAERDRLRVEVLRLESLLRAHEDAIAVLGDVLALFVTSSSGGWARSVNVLAEDLEGWRAVARKASGA